MECKSLVLLHQYVGKIDTYAFCVIPKGVGRKKDTKSWDTRRSRSRRKKKSKWAGTVRLGALFAVLVGINVYVFFFRGGTSIGELIKASAIKGDSADPLGKKKRVGSDDTGEKRKYDGAMMVQGALSGHLGLSSALAASHLDSKQITVLVKTLATKVNMRTLRPSNKYEIYLDPQTRELLGFVYHLSEATTVELERQKNGLLAARKIEVPLETQLVKLGGQIDSSLEKAVSEIGGSSTLVAKYVDLFSWDINWYVDPRLGDKFRIVVEKKYLKKEFYGYGKIVAAEYDGEVGKYHAFLYTPRGGEPGYFTADGRSIRRPFLKTPLRYRRISSKFSHRRFHPILHYHKAHAGVDFAAAKGTPVWAAANGWVVKVGQFGGAGKMVMLRHPGAIETVYMHLSGFAKGIKLHAKVLQHEKIGYVGSSGLATGPHLHYGIKVNGHHVNPLQFKVPMGARLPKDEHLRFLEQIASLKQDLEGISIAK
ncbi:MAG: M23 family metallopeptidase [Pseudomonadota bacterium]